MKRIENIRYANKHEQQVLDLYIPDCDSFKVFIYLHGGGMESEKKDDYIKHGNYLASQGHAAVIINYRLYPNAKYPEFIEDSAAAISWVFNNIESYGTQKGIYVGGSSAGGYLSMMLCFNKSFLKPYGISPMDISGFFHDAGQPTAHFNVLRERGIDSRRVIVDETAPLYYVGVDEKYPPMRLIVSDNDMEGRPEQMNLLAATLNHFGHTESFDFKLMHGEHCHYVHETDEDGVPNLAKMIDEFLNEY